VPRETPRSSPAVYGVLRWIAPAALLADLWRPEMYWRLAMLTRKDTVGILLASALFAVVAVAFVFFPNGAQQANWGFGLEWECTNPGKGPVCVRKQSAGERSPGQPVPASSEVQPRH
jgi:hypothetical protein